MRPLRFYNGLARIVEKVENCLAVPLAVRYEFLGGYKPEVFVQIGKGDIFFEDKNFRRKELTENFQAELTKILDELKLRIQNKNFDEFQKI